MQLKCQCCDWSIGRPKLVIERAQRPNSWTRGISAAKPVGKKMPDARKPDRRKGKKERKCDVCRKVLCVWIRFG